MNKGLEALKGQSQERSNERFSEIRTQRAWWESRENDQWNRVAGRVLYAMDRACQGHETTRPVPLRGHSSKNIEGELHQSKKIIRKFWLRGWRKSPQEKLRQLNQCPWHKEARMGWSTFQNHRQLLLFQVPFARIFHILFNCFKNSYHLWSARRLVCIMSFNPK